MKTKILSSMVVLGLFTACAKDVKVADGDLGDKLRGRAAAKEAAKSGEKRLRFGSYAASTMMAEKQVEVLEILALALPNTTKSITQYTREVTKDGAIENGTLEQKITLKSDSKVPLVYDSGSANYSLSLNKQWDVTAQSSDGKLISVKATKIRRALDKPDPKKPEATQAQMTNLDATGADKGKTFVSLFENELDITATLAEDGETLNVTAVSQMSIRAKRDSVSADNEYFTMTVSFSVNANALATDDVIATKDFKGGLSFEKKSAMTASSALMKVRLENLCNDLEGVVSIDQDRTKKTVVFAKDDVKVTGTNYLMPVAQCGERPAVDLTRYLILLF